MRIDIDKLNPSTGHAASSYSRTSSASVSLGKAHKSSRARDAIFQKGAQQILSNLYTVGDGKVGDIIQVLATSGIHLLAMSLPRTPLAPDDPEKGIIGGKLRESARATVFSGNSSFIVGEGRKDGSVKVRQENILRKISGGLIGGGRRKKLPTRLGMNVSFFREGTLHGELIDVALWTHESIYYQSERPKTPAARTPGTGPKYLTIPFLENQWLYVNALKSLRIVSEIDYKRHMLKQVGGVRKGAGIKDYRVQAFKLVKSRMRQPSGNLGLIMEGAPS